MRGRVLIADDDKEILKVLTEYLESEGYAVVGAANNGREACVMNETLKPDVVVMDIEMPEMDGLEAARTMKSVRPVPIVLCTGCQDYALIGQAVEVGGYGLLYKPLRLSELLSAIALAISRHREVIDLRMDLEKMRETLESRKWIEKAKGILMKTQNIDEEQAHRYLQIESQRRSQPITELAKAVVTAEEMFKVKVIGQVHGNRKTAVY